MTGALALHGGGEFLPGDEPFLRALLEAARPAAVERALRERAAGGSASEPVIRAVVLPTASARGQPEATVAHGRDALRRVASEAGVAAEIDAALIVDRAGASDLALAATLAGADLIHLPGGDPDLIPAILAGTAASAAILEARIRGAVVAGASAGAMGMAVRTWTPHGWIDGLGLVRGLVVVPHFAGFDRRGWEATVDSLRSRGIGILGLDERTGVLSQPGAVGAPWRVVGEGRAHWFPPAGEPVSATDGQTLDLPG